ncbi:MAG: hypothetical protein E7565_07260 [Ruminococcaceae bacterium]|nr:hypothetical protein [Oscillospiraceae bacterium]
MNINGFEIERKFLIKYPDINKLLDNPLCRVLKMEQFYLQGGGRVRKIEENGKITYIKTVKKHITDIKREEKEWEIEEEEYIKEIGNKAFGTNIIKKTRYAYPFYDLIFEIDLFPFWNDRAFLEIELNDETQEFIVPEFLKIIKEVTADKRYNNSSLAREILNEAL